MSCIEFGCNSCPFVALLLKLRHPDCLILSPTFNYTPIGGNPESRKTSDLVFAIKEALAGRHFVSPPLDGAFSS